jgi:hypothetical protein
VIGKIESDSASLEMVYGYFLDLKTYYTSLPLNNFISSRKVVEIIENKWSLIHTESMGFGFVLSPANLHRLDVMEGSDYEDTIDQLKKYISDYFEEDEDQIKETLVELNKYFEDYESCSSEKKVTINSFIYTNILMFLFSY